LPGGRGPRWRPTRPRRSRARPGRARSCSSASPTSWRARDASAAETLAEASAEATLAGTTGHGLPCARRARRPRRARRQLGRRRAPDRRGTHVDPRGRPRRLPDERAHLRDERPRRRCARATGCGRARMPDTLRVPCRC
jgi:hypothetical protein